AHEVLADHQRRGKKFIPPFIHMLGPMQEVSWIRTIFPELLWIAFIQSRYGHRRGVELITNIARTARNIFSGIQNRIFGAVSEYSELCESQWEKLRLGLAKSGDLFLAQKALKPLISHYPECPLRQIFSGELIAANPDDLEIVKRIVGSLYYRSEREPMMVQATYVWLAFDSDMLKVREGLALAKFPEIENYPNTELSKKVGSAIRAGLNGIFGGIGPHYSDKYTWPKYFWNRGLVIDHCELNND
ncbi:MAG: hypothetical protein HY743_10595, partial [Deltaproteobacteria bacterium]|nr:hypothetical protein [Deltaproteobacteria bacterium]